MQASRSISFIIDKIVDLTFAKVCGLIAQFKLVSSKSKDSEEWMEGTL